MVQGQYWVVRKGDDWSGTHRVREGMGLRVGEMRAEVALWRVDVPERDTW